MSDKRIVQRIGRIPISLGRDFYQWLRIKPFIIRTFGYAWNRSRDNTDIISTYKCNRHCFDCSQMCRQASSTEKMTVEQVKKFIRESINAKKHWKAINVMGGESLLEDETLDIFDLLIDYKNKYSKQTKIILVTNGLGPKVNEMLKKVPKEVNVYNNKKTSQVFYYFRAINSAPIDKKEYQDKDFKNGCYILKKCGISLCRGGYYCCSNAGAIDRVFGFNLGRKTLPKDNDDMRDQMDKLCRYCGFFLYKDYKKEPGFQSDSWKKKLAQYKLKKPKIDQY